MNARFGIAWVEGLSAFIEKLVWFLEEAEHETAVWGMRVVTAAGFAPDEVAGGAGAFMVDK